MSGHRSFRLFCLLAVLISGCGREFHIITPIPNFTASSSVASGARESVMAGDARKPLVGPQAGPDLAAPPGSVINSRPVGVWLARNVYERAGAFKNTVRLKAIEILFCPLSQAEAVGESHANNREP